MKIIASGKSGTIGRHLDGTITPLNQRIDSINEKNLNISEGDTYVHLAAMVSNQAITERRRDSYLVNVESTIRLAEYCLQMGAKRFIFISTSHVYDSGLDDKSEESSIKPINLYAEQKFEAEEKLRYLFKGNEKCLTILRVFSVLDWDTKPFTLGGGIAKILSDKSFNLSNGDDIRDFLTPNQVAGVIHRIALVEPPVQLMNVCTGEGTTIAKAAQLLLSEVMTDDLSHRIDSGTSNHPRLVGDATLLNSYLGTPMVWKYLENNG